MVLPLLALVLVPQDRSPDPWAVFAREASTEVVRRRPDLVGFWKRGERTTTREEDEAAIGDARKSWIEGRRGESYRDLCRAALAAGEAGWQPVEAWGRLLLQAGEWERARDLIGANLDNDPMDLGHFRFAVALAESGTSAPGLETFCRAYLGQRWEVSSEEMARVYPAGAEGIKRLAWAVYATHALVQGRALYNISLEDWNTLTEPQRFRAGVFTEEYFATPEALRRDPSDPVAAFILARGCTGHHDTVITITSAASRKKKADAYRALFAPAFRRLRKGDMFERRLRGAIADAEDARMDARRFDRKLKPGG